MSIMGRLAAGLGAGAATLGQKYIDEEVAQQRAQFLADLQRTTASTIRKDDDEFRNDPARVARDRENKRQEVLTAGQAQQEVELSKANNTVLNEAQRRVEDEKAAAEIKRKVEAGKALLPLELERASKLAAADAGTRAKYREKPQTMAEKAAELEAFLGRKLLTEERERFAGLGKKVDVGEVTEKTTENDANGLPVKERTVKRPLMPGELDKPRPTEQQAHAEAEAAIKSGAPRDAVNARLVQAGFKPLGGAGDKPGMTPGAERAARSKPTADYRLAGDGSGRMVDVTTGRTLTPEQSAILQKMQRGEPTTPRERAMLAD